MSECISIIGDLLLAVTVLILVIDNSCTQKRLSELEREIEILFDIMKK